MDSSNPFFPDGPCQIRATEVRLLPVNEDGLKLADQSKILSIPDYKETIKSCILEVSKEDDKRDYIEAVHFMLSLARRASPSCVGACFKTWESINAVYYFRNNGAVDEDCERQSQDAERVLKKIELDMAPTASSGNNVEKEAIQLRRSMRKRSGKDGGDETVPPPNSKRHQNSASYTAHQSEADARITGHPRRKNQRLVVKRPSRRVTRSVASGSDKAKPGERVDQQTPPINSSFHGSFEQRPLETQSDECQRQAAASNGDTAHLGTSEGHETGAAAMRADINNPVPSNRHVDRPATASQDQPASGQTQSTGMLESHSTENLQSPSVTAEPRGSIEGQARSTMASANGRVPVVIIASKDAQPHQPATGTRTGQGEVDVEPDHDSQVRTKPSSSLLAGEQDTVKENDKAALEHIQYSLSEKFDSIYLMEYGNSVLKELQGLQQHLYMSRREKGMGGQGPSDSSRPVQDVGYFLGTCIAGAVDCLSHIAMDTESINQSYDTEEIASQAPGIFREIGHLISRCIKKSKGNLFLETLKDNLNKLRLRQLVDDLKLKQGTGRGLSPEEKEYLEGTIAHGLEIQDQDCVEDVLSSRFGITRGKLAYQLRIGRVLRVFVHLWGRGALLFLPKVGVAQTFIEPLGTIERRLEIFHKEDKDDFLRSFAERLDTVIVSKVVHKEKFEFNIEDVESGGLILDSLDRIQERSAPKDAVASREPQDN